ncbi:MAG TPA: hypothetical protein VET90_08455, partial [Candidatus Binatus sp.]|nr:hypothetical protein [Candidatus Binatus sp.]
LELATTADLTPDFRRRFLETAVSHGEVTLRRPDGAHVRTRYRSIEGVPAPGLRAIVVSRPDDREDPRPTTEIVVEALRVPEAAAAG